MGQDRELTDEQKRFALTTVKLYKEIWEKQEIACLTKDRDRKLELLNVDPEQAQANDDANNADITDKMDAMVVNEDYFQPPDTEKVLYAEDLQEIENGQKRLSVEGQRWAENEEWKKMLANI